MYHRILLRIFSLIIVSMLVIGFIQPPEIQVFNDQLIYSSSESSTLQPLVINSSRNDISDPLKDIPPVREVQKPGFFGGIEIPNRILPKAVPSEIEEKGDESLFQESPLSPATLPAPMQNFDGVANLFGGWPPDTQGDIGSDHYVQWINLHFAIWRIDKINHTSTLVYGPVAGNTLFQGFGGVCQTTNNGDPITLYDPFAQRWFMSQFALPNWPNGPFYQCVAVSKTVDPTGAWYRYEFPIPVNKMNDYPKFGVWPDAYYMTVNQYNSGSMSWGGAAVAALERSAMLVGDPARMVYMDLYNIDSRFGGMLPADFDGIFQPPVNSPGYFLEWDDGSGIPSQDAVRLWEFHVNWNDPGSSTFGLAGLPNQVIPTSNVDPDLCGYARNCIPQPGTSTRLDAISDRLMYRLQYRNFGGYETLVTNHSVDVNGTDRSGIHWFELRKVNGGGPPTWSIFQQGVYSPDSNHRWMGSLAMDHMGNIALGYSVSSSSVYPSVRYTGRMVTDPLGTLPQGEQTLVSGSGSQTGSSRWGDYSMMGLDPNDDCTFWYTQQYVATTGSNTWKTRIGSFRFPSCSVGDQGTLEGTVTDLGTGLGIEGAQVRASKGITQTYPTLTIDGGAYSMMIPVGTYSVTASSYGYLPLTVSGLEILADTVTVQDFALSLAPSYVVSGTVTDAITGWPLYARISINGAPIDPVWSNPVTGFYSISLPEGTSYTFQVQAISTGYNQANISVGPIVGDMTQNINLEVNQATCEAPGYQLNLTPVYSSDFETDNGNLVISGTTSWLWGEPSSGPGLAHSGSNVWATNLAGNYGNNENGYLTSSPIDLSGYTGQSLAISWWQWLETESGYDKSSLEVSKDGGIVWDQVYGPVSGSIDQTWTFHYNLLDDSYSVSNFQLRFHFTSDSSITFPGWYLDDLTVGPGQCAPQNGGLVIGNIYDANNSQGLVGATITSDSGLSTTSQSTPDDPSVPDGFYTLFSLFGSHTFTSTMVGGYQSDVEVVDVPHYGTIQRDFIMEAGLLNIEPLSLESSQELGTTNSQPLTLTNQGKISLTFEVFELEKGSVPLGPFEVPAFGVKSFKQNLPSTSGLGIPAPPEAAPLAAGEVIQSWTPEKATGPWGIAYDGINKTVWVSSPSPSWGGVDRLYEYSSSGIATGRSFPHTSPHSVGPADLAFNWKTGMLWSMNVTSSAANCIYEIDPRLGYTGEYICPGGGSGFIDSQRGLAYDPYTDTWFAGGWNDLMVHRFDSAGNLLSSVQTGLAIAGLAYNPESEHLFVMVNSNPNKVYVLNVADEYSLLGEFSVSQGFSSGAGAGLEFDCSGDLWAVDMNTDTVYQFSSGETTNLCEFDVPWLDETPDSGEIDSSNSQPLNITFDATVSEIDQPGVYHAQLKIKENTPYYVSNIPVTMTVTAPPGWGKLNGIVSGLGYCDLNPNPLMGADVNIESSGGLSWTLTTDDSGYYQSWLDQGGSPYTVTVTATDHQVAQVNGIQVLGGITMTEDLSLHWLEACLSYQPEKLESTLKIGSTKTISITIDNSGFAPTGFEFFEIPVDMELLSIFPSNVRPVGDSLPDARVAPSQPGFGAPAYIAQAGELLLDEGFEGGTIPPSEWTQVINNPKTWSLDSSTSHSGTYSTNILYDYDQDEWLLSPPLYITEGILSLWSMGSLYWCRDTSNNCDLNLWIVVGEIGGGDDVWVGRADDDWISSYTWSQSIFDLTSLLPGGSVRLGFQYLGDDGAEVVLDEIMLEGREGGDVTWLALSPISGTLPANSYNSQVNVVFDASVPEIASPGEYYALLKLRSDDPVHPSSTIPVTMTVTPLEYSVSMSGDMALHDIPGETVTYTLQVTNTSEGLTDSFLITAGPSAWLSDPDPEIIGPLDSGESTSVHVFVQIPQSASPGDFDTVLITASSIGDATKTATATLTTTADTPLADLEIRKIAFANPIIAGTPLTYELTVTNHGPTKAPRVTIMDVLPPGAVYVSASSSAGEPNCTLSNYVVVCTPGRFLSGESRTFYIIVSLLKLGELTNHAFVVADPEDLNPDNNWDFIKVLVEGYLFYYPLVAK